MIKPFCNITTLPLMESRTNEREMWFETIVGKDLFEFICGEYIDYGSQRVVFDYKLDRTCVVKLQSENGFQNAMEWELWHDSKGTDARKWLAPCVQISPNGIWLIQKKTSTLLYNKLPKKMPKFLADFNPDNFGMYAGRVVCHDYGKNLCAYEAIKRGEQVVDWSEHKKLDPTD